LVIFLHRFIFLFYSKVRRFTMQNSYKTFYYLPKQNLCPMLKKFINISLSCLFVVCLGSCKKDTDNGANSGGTSFYTLEGAPGGCTGSVIAGIYSVGTALTSANTVTLSVNVASKGTYSMRTTSVNGVYFSGSGTFTSVGLQNIILTGVGTPVRKGIFSFVPSTNNTCNFDVSFIDGLPSAVFTYSGAPSACTAPAIAGTYGIGVALGSGNYADLAVNVTTPGAYTISTNSVNGISFSGSGAFTATGAQVVRLIGNGTPAAQGTYTYTPSPNGCSFTINLTTAGGTSVYTLDCSAPVISGMYTAGVPLGAGNTVTIKANVTTAGTYSISTSTINGMTFSASGSFAIGTGQNIVLTGSGTPTTAGSNNFTIAGGCSFSITTVAPPPAAYTLTCNGTTVSGSYVTGTALTTSNKVDVEVNVATAGAYTITSNTVNGMTFSKSGVFTGTGIQTVTLNGSGTPVSPGTNNFTVGAANCPFNVTVTAPTSPCSGLVDGKFVMTGQFTLNGFSFGVPTGSGQYQVTIQDGFIQLDAFFPGNNPPSPGIYSIGTVTMHCLYVAGTTAIDWNATSGSVYVSVDGSGDTVIEFCNVNFLGTILFPGGTVTSTGAGKMVL
jgi:hypothetical protein